MVKAFVGMDAEVFRQHQRNQHGPDWRWDSALGIFEHRSCAWHLWRRADEHVRRAVRYLHACRKGAKAKAAADPRFALVAAAEQLWQDESMRQTYQLMLLGNLPSDEIAQRLGISSAVLGAIEVYFFAIDELRSATSWIQHHVIDAAKPDLRVRLSLAFFGGPYVTRAILDAAERVPFEQAQRLADQQVLLSLKLREAMEMPLTSPKQTINFVKIYTEYDLQLRKLNLLERQLLARCEEIAMQHELSKMRMASRAERAQRKKEAAAKRQQAREQRALVRAEAARLQLEQQAARQQAIQERAADSALAQLTWECQTGMAVEQLEMSTEFVLAAA